jgi:hypothetical protein
MALFGGLHFMSNKTSLTPSQFIIYLTENVLELWTSLAFLYLSYAFHRNQTMQKEDCPGDNTNYHPPQILNREE